MRYLRPTSFEMQPFVAHTFYVGLGVTSWISGCSRGFILSLAFISPLKQMSPLSFYSGGSTESMTHQRWPTPFPGLLQTMRRVLHSFLNLDSPHECLHQVWKMNTSPPTIQINNPSPGKDGGAWARHRAWQSGDLS